MLLEDAVSGFCGLVHTARVHEAQHVKLMLMVFFWKNVPPATMPLLQTYSQMYQQHQYLGLPEHRLHIRKTKSLWANTCFWSLPAPVPGTQIDKISVLFREHLFSHLRKQGKPIYVSSVSIFSLGNFRKENCWVSFQIGKDVNLPGGGGVSKFLRITKIFLSVKIRGFLLQKALSQLCSCIFWTPHVPAESSFWI